MGSWLSEAIRWYLTLLLVGWAAAPVARWLFGRLPDRGATVAKPLGLLAVIWPTWWLASISPVPYTTAGLWVTLALVGLAGWGHAWRHGWIERDWIRALLVAEGITLVAFIAYIGFRGFTPQIAWTEKPMDLAFLASSRRTTEMPPADPWMAGQTINYYYLGYLVHGSIARMSAVQTWTGFNLALATTAALAFTGAVGLGYNVAMAWVAPRSARIAGVVAGFFVVMAGNMRAGFRFLDDPSGAWHDPWWGRVGWASSRVVVDTGSPQAETINEFPWFSLLLGDLHPHLTALPFTILALTAALAIVRLRTPESAPVVALDPFEVVELEQLDDDGNPLVPAAEPDPFPEPAPVEPPAADLPAWRRVFADGWVQVAVTGGIIGALYPMNSLDFPTFLLAGLGALLIAFGFSRRALVSGVVMVAGALVAWLPFWIAFVPFAGGDESLLPGWVQKVPVLPKVLTIVGVYHGERTGVDEFFTVFGAWWVIAVTALVAATIYTVRRDGAPTIGAGWWTVILGGIAAALLIPAPVIVLAGLPLLLAGWHLVRGWRAGERETLIPYGMVALAFTLIIGTEFFYVQDVFDGRYNTLFKVYYGCWTLLAVAGAVALVILWRRASATGGGKVALGVLTLFVAGFTAAYALIATPQWTVAFTGARDWQGLDGSAFMRGISAGEVDAFQWLAENAEPGDVIAEAPGCQYQVNGGIPTGRMAAFTGVPNLVGWDGAEMQWRQGQPDLLGQIIPRGEDVAAIYADPASPLVDQYGVTLLVVGLYERNGAGESCAKAGPFPATLAEGYPGPGWTEIFRSGDTAIYRRDGS